MENFVVAETKGPKQSRVIIFSNFRGSVRCKSISLNLSVCDCYYLVACLKFVKAYIVIVIPFRDIINALATIGDLVKATEFIGQSSGL